jgi:hypothetical protein
VRSVLIISIEDSDSIGVGLIELDMVSLSTLCPLTGFPYWTDFFELTPCLFGGWINEESFPDYLLPPNPLCN